MSTSHKTTCMESSSGEISSQSSRYIQNFEDQKWATYLHDDAEEGKPKIGIQTRIKVIEDSEEKLRKEAYKRGITSWKSTKIPIVEERMLTETKSETASKPGKLIKKGLQVKEIKSLEGSEEVVKSEKKIESKKRKEEPEHEEDIKKSREHLPMHYMWNPDPLFYLHLTQLGYSRIAVEKALYCTDNKSVELAEQYIQEHPDLTPLTKEEVIADAKALFNKIIPNSLEDEDSGENERKIEDNDQSVQLGQSGRSFEEEETSMNDFSKGEKKELLPNLKDGVKSAEETESADEVELLCVINSGAGLNVITLATECSRATVKIMEELQKEEWKTLGEDWIKYGKCVNSYQSDGALHLYRMQENLSCNGHLSYLAEIPNPLFPDSLLPAVLCTLTRTHVVKTLCPSLSQVD